MKNTTIELLVRNHPGVMSHITGLFSRRYFNLLGIVYFGIPENKHSKIFLLVENNLKIEQMLEQLRKLFDVISLRKRDDIKEEQFISLQKSFES